MKDDTTLINKVLEKIPNKYMAVTVASKRARAINSAINEGRPRPIKTNSTKPTTMALEEIAAGRISYETVVQELPEDKIPEPEMLLPANNSSDEEAEEIVSKEEKEIISDEKEITEEKDNNEDDKVHDKEE